MTLPLMLLAVVTIVAGFILSDTSSVQLVKHITSIWTGVWQVQVSP